MSAAQWQDLELEREILADAVLGSRAAEYIGRISPADFADYNNGHVFDALCGISGAGGRPDYATIRAWLADHDRLDPTTGAALIDALKDGGIIPIDAGRSCERLRTLSNRRALHEAMRRGLAYLDEHPQAAEEGFADEFSARLINAASTGDASASRPPLVSASDAIDQWASMPPISERVLPLGVIPAIDAQMRGGLEPGEAMFKLARPGSLKTMLMLNIVLRWLARMRDSFFVLVELEMPKRQLIERLARMHFQLNSEVLDHRRRRDALDVAALKDRLSGLYIVDDVGLTLANIEQRVRLAQRQAAGKTLGGVLIDHCGLIRATQGSSAYDRATDTAIGIKQLARRLEVPVIAVVQANRTAASSSREGSPPEMEQARDSGAYEENADFMLSLSAIQTLGQTQYVAVKLVKNRRGGPWITNVGFDPHSLRMAELAEDGSLNHAA